MKSVVIGTAGHIDHGKTALVKALTGIDADRLEEEKRRGITIDIGFAHLDLPVPNGDTLRLGFVDVPGHERFVRNMLAGVGGIDIVLLVIAADESIKPQTREHFDICRLLSVRRGITVLTKSDLVDPETLDVVRLEVEDFLAGSFLDPMHSPIICVSSLTGAGLDELKRGLVRVASEVPAKDSAALARLPIDRVFTMKGFGTVVTGTLISGTVSKEDELELLPAMTRARVRGVQVHGKPASEALAGQRTALNLVGVEFHDLGRGMTLAAPSSFHPTSRIDVSLSLLAGARRLKDRSRVHFHSYTFETIATVDLLGEKQLLPGQTAFAQLRLNEPALLLPGDRFIVRQFSPVVTIGGGSVLDNDPLPKIRAGARLQFLQDLERSDPSSALHLRIARRGRVGLSLAQAVAETGWRNEAIESAAAPLMKAGTVVRIQNTLMDTGTVGTLRTDLLQTIAKVHEQDSLAPGTAKEILRERLRIAPEILVYLLGVLVNEKQIEMLGETVRLPGRGTAMKDEEIESRKAIEHAFASAGFQVPALKDVLAALKIDRARAQKIVTLLLREKTLVKISEDLVFHRSALEDIRKRLIVEKAKSAKLDVARFKVLTGVTRKYAIPLLEYFDREHVTRRVGDERLIL